MIVIGIALTPFPLEDYVLQADDCADEAFQAVVSRQEGRAITGFKQKILFQSAQTQYQKEFNAILCVGWERGNNS